MSTSHHGFDLQHTLHELQHYLPAQAPLKDFIHHNTLHAFQKTKFLDALHQAATTFGYKTTLSIGEYRARYKAGDIQPIQLERMIRARKGDTELERWQDRMLNKTYSSDLQPRIGQIRHLWKTHYRINLDALVHPLLFRILCSYLDQGISIWDFPVVHQTFLDSVRELESHSFSSFFRSKRARKLLQDRTITVEHLLGILLGTDAIARSHYERYLFDQQFAHQGWSGMVATIEQQPQTLLDQKGITLQDWIMLELLLEIDALDCRYGTDWEPMGGKLLAEVPTDLLAATPATELSEVLGLWQLAFEWSYFDQVLSAVGGQARAADEAPATSFQAMFCIDDRECSLRRYLEQYDPHCATFGTPGFFSVEFYFQPQGGKFHTKLCPAPMFPKYLIKELGSTSKRKRDLHLDKNTHSLFRGWLITQTLGFWSALRLFLNIVRPATGPASASSFLHMDKVATLSIENTNPDHIEDGLQVGFQVHEMADRVENLLRSIGLVKDFAPLVYVIGHGSSSTNNPHYAAYDCGACSGRPGSVNARVICHMANHVGVREILRARGLDIPAATQFVGGLHDTTRDEIAFYDEDALRPDNLARHRQNEATFDLALSNNAKERSRRLELIDTHQLPVEIHERIKRRSVSLFEPRPELNHATNALCIVGRRSLTRHVFLDRRSFLNSYDYRIDPEGKYLFGILRAAAPVCGGINLEYFFSRVDNQKLGAGTKLPHNVMGLFGVANGADGDLRPGLPHQMIEVHDPLRLLIIVEHRPDVVLATIQRDAATYEWFDKEWVHLVAIDPDSGGLFRFEGGAMLPYRPAVDKVPHMESLRRVLETHCDNIPVQLLP